MKTCECIEVIRRRGYNLPFRSELRDVTAAGDTKPKYAESLIVSAYKWQNHTQAAVVMTHCPFCGKPLHEVTYTSVLEREKHLQEDA